VYNIAVAVKTAEVVIILQ